jgi:hypothetical protein
MSKRTRNGSPNWAGQSLTIAIALIFCCMPAHAQELNTILMNSTFKIVGPNATIKGNIIFGTVFIMAKPIKERPDKGYFVLITAAHVLDKIGGEEAVLQLRRKDAGGTITAFGYPIQIRTASSNLYTTHPEGDVAAMYVSLPHDVDIRPLTIEALVDDDTLERLQVHPGDELFCLGFPLDVDLNGFPILRTGTLASYPITPSKTVKKYYYDFHVFPGNSGGPVYFSFVNRIYANAPHFGSNDEGVIGLVVEQVGSARPEFKDLSLDVSRVVPSSYIRDTIAQLPETPPSEALSR